ncbi:unnamed protein product, partial [Ectocarpus sp. 12 AP-2014]
SLTQQELCDACVCHLVCGDGGGGGASGVTEAGGVRRRPSSPEGPRIDWRSHVPTPAELVPQGGLSDIFRSSLGGGGGGVGTGGEPGSGGEQGCSPRGVTGGVQPGVGHGTTTPSRSSSLQQQQQRSSCITRKGGGTKNRADAASAAAAACAARAVNGGARRPPNNDNRAEQVDGRSRIISSSGSGSGSGSGSRKKQRRNKVDGTTLLSGRLNCDVGEFVVFPTPRTSPVPFLLGKVLRKRVLASGKVGVPSRTEVTVHWYTPKTRPPPPPPPVARGNGDDAGTRARALEAEAVVRYTVGGWSGDFVP